MFIKDQKPLLKEWNMTNLVLFYCDRMQGFFGLGAHIEELLKYFRKQEDICITLILTESERFAECTFVQDDGMDILYIPSPENGLFLSMEDSLVTKTLALRILQIVYPYLKDKDNMVCWFNSIAELNLAKQLRDFFSCKILYVHHSWGWKDHTKVEDQVFAREWKSENKSFCPAAFKITSYQLHMVGHSDYCITVTRQAQNFYESAFDVTNYKLCTIYNGITPPATDLFDKATIKCELGIPEDEKVILFSGRVIANKGVFFLVDAFKQLLEKIPDCRLVLVGTGTLGEVLRAAMPVWSKITLTDFMNREWMQKWYAIADVGVLPSLMEQCSYTAIEMRFWRIPLIVSAVDGLDEVFEHEVDCLKIPVHHDQRGERILEPSEIREAMHRLITDRALCNQLIGNGYKKALKRFTLEKMGGSYLEIVRKLGNMNEYHSHNRNIQV